MASVYALGEEASSERPHESKPADRESTARANSFVTFLGSDGRVSEEASSPAQFSGAFYAGRYHNNTTKTNKGRNQHWNAQRREIFSELRFDVPYFLWSMLYELLPTILSGPLVRCLSNKAESENRSFWPVNPVLDAALYFTIYWVTYASIAYPSAHTSVYDALALWVYVFGRAATIGVKYALYGNLDKDANVGIRSEHYKHTGRQDKNLMAELCFNIESKQMSVLAENLHASCLKRDCDLSCATIRFQSARHSQSMLREVTKVLDEIRHVDKEENLRLEKAGMLQRQHLGEAANSHHAVLLNHKFAISAASNPNGGLRQRSNMSTNRIEIGTSAAATDAAASTISPGAKVPIKHDRGLLRDLVCLDMEVVESMARQAELPASIIALHCLSVSHHVFPKIGLAQFFSNIFIGIVCAFVPPIVRAIEGKVPFGETHGDKSIIGCSVVAFSFWFFIMVFYSMAPLMFFYRHLKVEKYLHRMLAGKWDEHSLQLKDEEVFFDDDCVDGASFPEPAERVSVGEQHNKDLGYDGNYTSGKGVCPPPQIDLSIPSNVVGFAALRRVLHGGNFAPIIQRRFSYDLCVSVIAVFSDAMIQNFGSRFDTQSTTFASKVTSTVRLMILASLIMPQIIVTWYINRFTDFHSLEIARGRLANLALASEVKARGKSAELMRAAFFLESSETEVAADDRSNPVRAGIYRANLTLLSVLGSAIMAVLYFDLQSLLATIEGSSAGVGDGGSIANETTMG